jgi:hypothetical protein
MRKYLLLDNIISMTYISVQEYNFREIVYFVENLVRQKRENIVSQMQAVTSISSLLALAGLSALIFSQNQISEFLGTSDRILQSFVGMSSSDGLTGFLLVICLSTMIFLLLRYFWNCFIFLKILEIIEIVCILQQETNQLSQHKNGLMSKFRNNIRNIKKYIL